MSLLHTSFKISKFARGTGILVKMIRNRFSTLQSSKDTDIMLTTPVMMKQVLKHLNLKSDQLVVDMTFGAGGHSRALLDLIPGCKLIALDRDPVSYECAQSLEKSYPGRVIPLLGKFSELPTLLKELDYHQNSVDAFLFHFGCSSMQYATPSRGFSMTTEGPLDMRMDYLRFPDHPCAMDILAQANEVDLARILKIYGEEKLYKKIANAIVESRYLFRKLETTHELANFVSLICEDDVKLDQLDTPSHRASKVFQALRIFVNNELNEINYGMLIAHKYLKLGGRVVTISSLSLEDTIVKRHISGNLANDVANTLPLKYSSYTLVHEIETMEVLLENSWQSLSKHVILPSLEQTEDNPNCKSSKMRAAIKIK